MDSWTGRDNTIHPGAFFCNSDEETVNIEIAQLYLITSSIRIFYFYCVKFINENSGTQLRILRKGRNAPARILLLSSPLGFMFCLLKLPRQIHHNFLAFVWLELRANKEG